MAAFYILRNEIWQKNEKYTKNDEEVSDSSAQGEGELIPQKHTNANAQIEWAAMHTNHCSNGPHSSAGNADLFF